MLEKIDLFEARTRGYHTCRIPCLLVTPRGAVLATTEARRGGGGDYDDSDVLLRRSLDGGRTWSEAQVVVRGAVYGPGPCSQFVMVGDRESGEVHALFCHDYNRVFHMVSRDDGATFSEAEEITPVFEGMRADYPWQVAALGPGHGTQLRNGRMILPVWLSDGSGTEMGAGHRGHRPSCITVIYSDDRGRSWQRGEIAVRQQEAKNPSEALCVELSDGRVLLNVRNESSVHRRLIVTSADGVSGWGGLHYDEALLEPICMGSLVRHRWPDADGPGRVLFVNPDNLEKTMAAWACDRKRLTVKMSLDDCRTWPVSRVLEPGPAGYSDTGVLPDGTILCLYERGMIGGMCDSRALTLARFDLAWLGGGA